MVFLKKVLAWIRGSSLIPVLCTIYIICTCMSIYMNGAFLLNEFCSNYLGCYMFFLGLFSNTQYFNLYFFYRLSNYIFRQINLVEKNDYCFWGFKISLIWIRSHIYVLSGLFINQNFSAN